METSNAAGGYVIKARSANSSTIKHSSAADNVDYTMRYAGGSNVTLTTSDQVVKTQDSGSTYTGVNSNVMIS